ncbi:MAG: M14 family zinc carboxypeptidase [Planctomycetota bacterium]
MRHALFLLLCGALVGQTTPPASPPRHLVQVLVRDAHTMDRLLRLDLDLAACTAIEIPAKKVDVIATDADIDTLRQAGLDFEVAIVDLEKHYAAELAKSGVPRPQTLTPPLGQGSMGGHYTYAEIVAILDSFARDYPTLCAPKVSIGQTHEGRDIWMVKMSDNVGIDENEPEVLFDGVHHAREPLSVETMLLFMDRLLTGYASDPEARAILDHRELFFVPVLNPDGHEYNRTTNPNGGGLWRKNRRNNGGGSFGVDINRNYATGWSAPNGGNSTDPNSETYRGPSPMSEPEIVAIDNFVQSRHFVQGMSCHTYTDILLHPWGWQAGSPTNVADYNAIGARATAQNGLAFGPVSTSLYIAAGTSVDHNHVVHGMLAWTPELGRSNEGGFWPNSTQTVAIANRHQHMLRQIAITSGAMLTVGTVAVTEGAGGNNNGNVEPGESGNVVVSVANDGGFALQQAVQLTLTAISPGITIGNGSTSLAPIARFGSANNASSPLTFSVPASYSGLLVELRVAAAADGQSVETTVRVPMAPSRVAVDDDMEQDRGFTRAAGGTATTGLFERSAPQQTVNGSTVIQPGANHSASGTLCWVTDGRAGTSAGTYDVDGGITELLSPRLDLRHLQFAQVSFWYWYAESTSDDAFEVAISNNDGSSWTPLLSTSTSTGAWVRFSAEIPLALTAQMRVRWRAQDNNPSLVEALVDDFAIEGIATDGALTLLSSGSIGSRARVGLNGRTGAVVVPLLSSGIADLPIPGVGGRLLLDPTGLVFLTGVPLGAGGFAAFDLSIPNVPALRGNSLHLQGLHVASLADLNLGNRQTLDLN